MTLVASTSANALGFQGAGVSGMKGLGTTWTTTCFRNREAGPS